MRVPVVARDFGLRDVVRRGTWGAGFLGSPTQEGRMLGAEEPFWSMPVAARPNLAAHWGQTFILAPSISTFRP
jgi:hypothetical protein